MTESVGNGQALENSVRCDANRLSVRAKSLWAKVSDDPGDQKWLPLAIHMTDSAGICKHLWKEWLSYPAKQIISKGAATSDGTKISAADIESLAVFLSAAHDLGKATPAFQGKTIFQNPAAGQMLIERVEGTGLFIRHDLASPNAIHHSVASECILERNGISRSVAVILGGHHGKPPSLEMLFRNVKAYPENTGFKKAEWNAVQDELFAYAEALSGMDPALLRKLRLSVQAQVILTGLVIMTDWMASDEQLFRYKEEFDYPLPELAPRVKQAWVAIEVPSRWCAPDDWQSFELYKVRFGFTPRPFQQTALKVAATVSAPGLAIIEAPMGEGKTEAALAMTEILAQRFGQTGMLFALPTQATADGIFPRLIKWIKEVSAGFDEERHSIFLAHGKSRFNTYYQSLREPSWQVGEEEHSAERVVVSEWFSGRKRGLLSDFVVGTVDQVLMGGLRQKHLAMRHLGLVNKVVIIDECHAYDEYMGSYLYKVLQWLGAYQVPVIILSATLPPRRRQELVEAYLGTRRSPVDPASVLLPWAEDERYPLITYTDHGTVQQAVSASSARSCSVMVERLTDLQLKVRLSQLTVHGGYIGLIFNTISRAQAAARELTADYPSAKVEIIHSAYTSLDRSVREDRIQQMLVAGNRQSAPFLAFIVGTQVMEQSLDLDFDLLVTDLCPMDLMLQRMGRLHRHHNQRPDLLDQPRCLVIDSGKAGFESGAEAVYGLYQLMNARELLPPTVRLPQDISHLVHQAYGPAGVTMPPELRDDYAAARQERDDLLKKRESRARVYQILAPDRISDLVGWLDNDHADDPTGQKAVAAVRDTGNAVEVILIQKDKEGNFRFLPWVEGCGGQVIPRDAAPDRRTAFTLAGCKVNLPRSLTAPYIIDNTIAALESDNLRQIPACWQQSEWLAGELFLVLDIYNNVRLLYYSITYDYVYGLSVVKCDERKGIQSAPRALDSRDERGRGQRGGEHRRSLPTGSPSAVVGRRVADAGCCRTQVIAGGGLWSLYAPGCDRRESTDCRRIGSIGSVATAVAAGCFRFRTDQQLSRAVCRQILPVSSGAALLPSRD